MKSGNLLVTILGVGVLLGLTDLQAGEPKQQPAREVPVEVFAAHAQYQSMVVSPDGKHIAFTFEEDNNEVKLAIATSDIKKITAVFSFGKDRHVGNQFWANNNRLIMSVWRSTGFLDGRRLKGKTFVADVDGGHRQELPAGFRILSRLRKDPKYILIGKYDYRDEGQIKLHKLDIKNIKTNYIAGIPAAVKGAQVVDVAVDTNDQIRFAMERDRGKKDYDDVDDSWSFHYKTEDGKWHPVKLQQARTPARFFKLGFNLDNSLFYFASNYDMAENDTIGVFSLDLKTGDVALVFRHPDVDVRAGIRGPDGELLGVRYEPGYPKTYYFNDKDPRVQVLKSLSATFPDQNVSVTSYTEDGQTAVVSVRSDRNPGDYYYYRGGKLQYLASVRPDIDPQLMGRTEPFIMYARDGVKLYGYVTLPPGREAKDLPMVVHPHGGPYGPYDRWGYNEQVQVLANHGYAVLQVNFRGSGGYGTDFQESGYRQWGRKMQDDVTDATLWAIQQGIADKDRICISGGSYGGYATMEGVVREPDLYKCAIGVAGVYSLPLFRKKGDYRRNREASEVFLDKYVGSDEAELRAYSPAYNVDKIKAAVFIIHGSKDVRVPVEHAEILRDQLDAIGKPYEWLVRPEGHGFTQSANKVVQYKMMLEFLDKYIGKGRQALD